MHAYLKSKVQGNTWVIRECSKSTVASEADINMDSYVVRIYRRDKRNPGKVAGQVEFIEQNQINSFTCVEELVTILDLKEKGAPRNISKIEAKARGSKIK